MQPSQKFENDANGIRGQTCHVHPMRFAGIAAPPRPRPGPGRCAAPLRGEEAATQHSEVPCAMPPSHAPGVGVQPVGTCSLSLALDGDRSPPPSSLTRETDGWVRGCCQAGLSPVRPSAPRRSVCGHCRELARWPPGQAARAGNAELSVCLLCPSAKEPDYF